MFVKVTQLHMSQEKGVASVQECVERICVESLACYGKASQNPMEAPTQLEFKIGESGMYVRETADEIDRLIEKAEAEESCSRCEIIADAIVNALERAEAKGIALPAAGTVTG